VKFLSPACRDRKPIWISGSPKPMLIPKRAPPRLPGGPVQNLGVEWGEDGNQKFYGAASEQLAILEFRTPNQTLNNPNLASRRLHLRQ
jgi:hypothetical protein